MFTIQDLHGSQWHQLSPAGRQEATQTLLSRQPETKDHSTPGGRELEARSPPPRLVLSRSLTLSGSNLTPYPETSLLSPGAALLDRPPPHFSTAVYTREPRTVKTM
jgi:hypothetical protein